VFKGHLAEIKALVFTPDGSQLISGSEIWDVAKDTEARTPEGHTLGVTVIALHRDGKIQRSGAQGPAVEPIVPPHLRPLLITPAPLYMR
jgi:WD40 repeat protein